MSCEEVIEKYNQLDANGKKQIDHLLEHLGKQSNDVPDEAIPLFGILKGKIRMAPDFDEPLDDFKDYM